MKRVLILGACVALAGCGTVNAWNAALLNKGAADYATAVSNLKDADDLKLKMWVDGACAVNVGALQRIASSTGNTNAVNAVFMACPVANVGVTSILPTGTMTVQTSNIAPNPPAK